MPVKLVLGLQHGDEGKGRIVDDLVQDWAHIVVRFQGGGNAGHTVYDETGNKFVTHILPVGVLAKDKVNIISKGCVLNLIDVIEEIKTLGNCESKLLISDLCPLIEPVHVLKDKIKYTNSLGTTAKGIGPAYSDYYARDAILLKDFVNNPVRSVSKMKEKITHLKSHIGTSVDTYKLFEKADSEIEFYKENHKEIIKFINQFLLLNDNLISDMSSMYNVLLEGAQGSGLSINSENYPNVTSSYPTIGGALNSTGLNHKQIDEVIGVIKAYKTKVGSGNFISRCDEKNEKLFIDIGKEYGATTGRTRMCGWLDIDEIEKAASLNGVDHICVVKSDVFKEIEQPYVYMSGTNVKINKINNVDHNKDQSFKEFLELIKIKTKSEKISYTTGPKRGQIVWNAM